MLIIFLYCKAGGCAHDACSRLHYGTCAAAKLPASAFHVHIDSGRLNHYLLKLHWNTLLFFIYDSQRHQDTCTWRLLYTSLWVSTS